MKLKLVQKGQGEEEGTTTGQREGKGEAVEKANMPRDEHWWTKR